MAAATPLSGITHISGRYLHTCVVVSVGGAHCWGDNGFGRLGDGTTVNPRLSPVAVLASGTAASSPVPLGGSLAFGPISLTVTVIDSTTATTSATVNLSSAP